ncbi:putative ABC transport system substrate-binding protein [Gammaproteobacteria bacterium]
MYLDLVLRYVFVFLAIFPSLAEPVVREPISVEPGQTLFGVATKTHSKKEGNLWQWAIALQRANPEAFFSPNINALRSGVKLHLPSGLMPSAEEARAEVERQNLDWRSSSKQPEARSKPTPQVATSPTNSVTPTRSSPPVPIEAVITSPTVVSSVSPPDHLVPSEPVTPSTATTIPPSNKITLTKPEPKPEVAASTEPNLDWLELTQEARKQWSILPVLGDRAKLRLVAEWLGTPGEPRKKILALIPKESESYSAATSELMKVLREDQLSAEITLVYWDKKDALIKSAIKNAEENAFDLIISMGSESAAFLHTHYRGGSLPVVTAIAKDPVLLGQMPDYQQGSKSNIAYTSLNVPVDLQINYLKDINARLENVAVIYDSKHAQVVATEVHPMQKRLTELGMRYIDVPVLESPNILEELQQATENAVKIMVRTDPTLEKSVFWVTSSTIVFTNTDPINRGAGNVPVIGGIPNAVSEDEDSVALAIGIDRRNNARLASLYAVRILRGEAKPGDLKVGVVKPPDIAINFKVAQKIGLKIPFDLFEGASFIYDYSGNPQRKFGRVISAGK